MKMDATMDDSGLNDIAVVSAAYLVKDAIGFAWDLVTFVFFPSLQPPC